MKLTKQQTRAAHSKSTLTLVVAGPGSGKTATLIERLHWLLVKQDVEARKICVLTFTNAAAQEIERRLAGIKLGYCGTLHGFCLKLLVQHGTKIGMTGQRVSVMDDEQDEELIQQIIEEQGQCHTIGAVKAYERAPRGRFNKPNSLDHIVKEYRRRMTETAMFSFDAVLRYGTEILAAIKGEAGMSELLVDEYQDSALQDHEFYRAMMARKFFVGDSDQSIYGFRGAYPQGMVATANEAKVFKLEENFRCSATVCRSANLLIAHNEGRIVKVTRAVSDREASVTYVQHMNEETELDWVAGIVMSRFHLRQSLAVLLRTNDLVERFTNHFVRKSIPVEKCAQTPPDWSRCRHFVSLLANPENDYLAWWWLKETVGEELANKSRLVALKSYQSINACCIGLPALPIAAVPDALVKAGMSAESRVLVSDYIANGSTSIANLAHDMMVVNKCEHDPTRVTVTTIHRAKGREWDTVMLPAFEEVVFGDKDVEEERRLAYVALTRARGCVFISSSEVRSTRWGKTPREAVQSRFIAQMGLDAQSALHRGVV